MAKPPTQRDAALFHIVCEAVGLESYWTTRPGRAGRGPGKVSFRRQIAIYLMREMSPEIDREEPRLSYPAIGRFFHRDHSTIIHSVKIGRRAVQTREAWIEKVKAEIERRMEEWDSRAGGEWQNGGTLEAKTLEIGASSENWTGAMMANSSLASMGFVSFAT